MAFGAISTAVAGLVTVVGSWAVYMATIPGGKVPARPLGHMAAQALGIGLAVAGVVAGAPAGGPALAATVALAAPTSAMGLLFFYLLTQRKTPVGSLAVRVGEPLLPFSATDSEGNRFESASLRGQRVLLKFFRGHW